MDKYVLMFLGPQGCGKGTQIKLINKRLQAPVIAIGELFRNNEIRNPHLSKMIKSYVEKGRLIPDNIILKIVEDEIDKISQHRIVILDGIPRSLMQKKIIQNLLIKYHYLNYKIIYIELDNKAAKKRMALRARDDDTKAVIAQRLKQYNDKTLPMIKEFEKENKVIFINGDQSIPLVYNEIINKIKKDPEVSSILNYENN